MKKILLLFVTIFYFSIVNAQIINIPDTNFKSTLLASSYVNQIAKNLDGNWCSIDTNSNGQIEVNEAHQISFLNLSFFSLTNSTNYWYNLIGIEYFTNLLSLDCHSNHISSLNLTSNILLNYLDCSINEINSLNISGLNNLQTLICNNNSIPHLDLTGKHNLNILNCKYNQLTTLDISDQYLLNFFDCSYNNLYTLFIKNGVNQSDNINFSFNTNLHYICADEDEVSSIQSSAIFYDINCGGIPVTVNSYCSFNPGGIFYNLQGNNRFDINNSGCNNSAIFQPNLKFNITNGTISSKLMANNSGNYNISIQAGDYQISPILENLPYFNISPTSVNISFPSNQNNITQNFCITPNGVHNDLEITIIPLIPARPGFNATYKLIYKNKGTTPQSGNINLYYDDGKSDFISAYPEPTNQTLNQIIWNYSNLQPFEVREINLKIYINNPNQNSPISVDDLLGYGATISPIDNDENPEDNNSDLKQIVIGSFDPNDKICNEGEAISLSKVGEYVHYVIHFENTGTANAENIIVKDIINTSKYNINSLIPISSSNSFITKISNTNTVEFVFENINLPFINGSNDGYVAFKIKTLPNLVVDDTFSNMAFIYFDYNNAIETNFASTTIQTLNNQDFKFNNYFILSPNPVKNTLNIQNNNNLHISTIQIYNTLGQLLFVETNPNNSIDVSNLNRGNYAIKIISNNGTFNMKFIKE